MSATHQTFTGPSSAQSEALVQALSLQFKEEAEALITVAEKEAKALIVQARADARSAVHDAIVALRQECALAATRAAARQETAKRTKLADHNKQALVRMLPMLAQAIAKCWTDPTCRERWIEKTALFCLSRLDGNAWLIECPIDWQASDSDRFHAKLGEAPVTLTFEYKDTVVAGLRVSADGATTDTTATGLMADRRLISGLLLDALREGERS